MNLFQSSNRALSIGLIGLKEAFMAVAERVARRVQAAKLQLQADDTEARLRQAYESLGQCLYTTHTAQTPETLKAIDEALPVCESIRAEQHTLQASRSRMAWRGCCSARMQHTPPTIRDPLGSPDGGRATAP